MLVSNSHYYKWWLPDSQTGEPSDEILEVLTIGTHCWNLIKRTNKQLKRFIILICINISFVS